MKEVSNYMFHYNHNRALWAAIPRDKQKEYWNLGKERHNESGIIYSDNIMTLLKFMKGGF